MLSTVAMSNDAPLETRTGSPPLRVQPSKVAEFVVIDTETTGLDPSVDRVVEIAAARYQAGQCVDELYSLVDPELPIPPAASAIHHITNSDIAGAPTINELRDAVVRFVGNAQIVAHNAAFDRSFLPFLAHKRWLCTMRLARHLWPDAPNFKNHTLRYLLGVELSAKHSHRAQADVAATAGVLFKALEAYRAQGHTATIGSLLRFVDSPVKINRMPFGKHSGSTLNEVPTDYLQWLVREYRGDDYDLIASVQTELERRLAPE